jgi:ATP-dependent Zn protease
MHEGKQSFEYILTPLKAGLLSIPAISFSYFDPLHEKYFTSSTQEHPLRVDPGESWIDSSPSTVDVETQSSPLSTTNLFQTENEPGEWVAKMKNENLLESNLFWSLQLLPFLLTCGLIFYGWKRKQSGRDIFRQKQANLKKQMKESISFNDPALFFRATRERLRLEIGTFYKHPNPFSLSTNELSELLENGSNEDSTVIEIQKILKESDGYEFAETYKDTQSLSELHTKINGLLKKIK